MKVCATPGCPTLTTTSRCPQHARARELRRGTPTSRGYGWQHARLRAQWVPRIASGSVQCHAIDCLEPSRRITPGEPWDLGHTPDRTAYTGPEHRRCNRAAGGKAAHR